jgi:hypothetical protein
MWPDTVVSHRLPAKTCGPASPGREPASSPASFGQFFSFPAVIAALLIVLTFFTVRGRFNDPDLWWHLKTGEIIWNTHSIPRVDAFSFTASGHPWVAQEWLSELTIYAAYKLGGYVGLMLWFCVLASLLVIAGYALCRLHSGNCKIAFVGAMGIWYFATIGFSIRPHLIGYFLLLCELLILHLGRTRDARWFFALPPLFALWINCHSSFIVGLIALAAVLICSFLDFRAGLLVSFRWEKPSRIALAASFVLSLAALFINPVGPKLLWYPLDVMFHQRLNLGIVSEWQPAPFSDMRAWSLLVFAALTLLVPLLRRIELRLDDLILVALGFALAVQHQRMLFVFGILTAPVLCRLLAGTWDRYEPEREHFLINACLIATAVLALVLGFPRSQNLAAQVSQGNPVNALAFINRSGLFGRMLNEYVYGGYLIWAAPQRKVFIDGRADMYEPAGVLADYAKFMSMNGDPQSILDKYRIDLCLLAPDNPMSRVLPLLPGWKKVYSDKQATVFARGPS